MTSTVSQSERHIVWFPASTPVGVTVPAMPVAEPDDLPDDADWWRRLAHAAWSEPPDAIGRARWRQMEADGELVEVHVAGPQVQLCVWTARLHSWLLDESAVTVQSADCAAGLFPVQFRAVGDLEATVAALEADRARAAPVHLSCCEHRRSGQDPWAVVSRMVVVAARVVIAEGADPFR